MTKWVFSTNAWIKDCLKVFRIAECVSDFDLDNFTRCIVGALTSWIPYAEGLTVEEMTAKGYNFCLDDDWFIEVSTNA